MIAMLDSIPMLKKLGSNLRSAWHYPYWQQVREGVRRGRFPIFLNYPVAPQPRYGWGAPLHPQLAVLLESRRSVFAGHVEALKQMKPGLCRISASASSDAPEPSWGNPWFTGLDGAAMYYFVASTAPKRILEIGSGNSTKFARQAIKDYGLTTEITCVDPQPRAEIAQVADRVLNIPLEAMDLSVLDDLHAGDILAFDGSHRCFMNSDVTVFFLEALPNIRPGVLIHIHDIFLPYDYPSARRHHFESEQYLVAAMLLAAPDRYAIEMANRYVIEDASMGEALADLWECPEFQITWKRGDWKRGSSFWFRDLGAR